jgi:hypothetical protein
MRARTFLGTISPNHSSLAGEADLLYLCMYNSDARPLCLFAYTGVAGERRVADRGIVVLTDRGIVVTFRRSFVNAGQRLLWGGGKRRASPYAAYGQGQAFPP